MAAFLNYINLIKSGEDLPGHLNFNLFVSQACACDADTRKLSVKWAMKQKNWNELKAVDAFFENYFNGKTTTNLMDFVKCLSAEYEKLPFQRMMYGMACKWFGTIGLYGIDGLSKMGQIVGDLYANDFINDQDFNLCVRRSMFSLLGVPSKLKLLTSMLQPVAIEKLKATKADKVFLFILKGYEVRTTTLTPSNKFMDQKDPKRLIKGLIKIGLFAKHALNFDKPARLQKVVTDWCNGKSTLGKSTAAIVKLEVDSQEEISYFCCTLVAAALAESAHSQKLVIFIKHLQENVFKSSFFVDTLIQKLFDDGFTPFALSIEPESYGACMNVLFFISRLFVADVIDLPKACNILSLLHRPESEDELKSKHPMYSDLKAIAFVSFYNDIKIKLPKELNATYHEILKQYQELVGKSSVILNEVVAMNKASLEVLQESVAASQKILDSASTPKLKKVQEPAQVPGEAQEPALTPKETETPTQVPEEVKQTAPAPQADELTATTSNAIKELPGFKKTLKKTVFGLKTDQKFQAFIEAILKNPSIDIETTLKDIEEMKSICDNSTDRRQLMFKTALTNALAEVFSEIKKSKLDEQTHSTISKLAIVYAKAYKWKLISSRMFCSFLRQKSFKVLSIESLETVSSETCERFNNNPSDEKQKAVKRLKALITCQKDLAIAVSLQSNIKTINTDDVMKDIEETASRFTEIFSVDEITLPEFYTPFCL